MAGRLPTGTITLLCTDIEGSTGIVGRLGGRYVDVLEEHRQLVRDAVEGAGGMEIDCRGDEMLLVFVDAEAAVRGAIEAQRALAAHGWPEGNEVRVRMGLHTGEPSVEGSTYVGLDVHRVARISDAGHGGQVLLSERTYELAGGDAIDLGPQPFKGLPEPERIYQVVADGLPQDFPPLRLGPEAAGMLVEASNPGAMRVVVAEDSVLLREGIARLLEDAGLEVVIARDLYPGVRCWSAVQDDETPAWVGYEGPDQHMFRRGEQALAAARRAGVFSVGMWVAVKSC